MKRYFILFLYVFLISCSSKKEQLEDVACPEVLFSKNHRIYIMTQDNNESLNEIDYVAEINNYDFNNSCLIQNNNITASLSLLFIIKADKMQGDIVTLPYYIAMLDNQKNILDIQYYKVLGALNKNDNDTPYKETEIINTQNIIIPKKYLDLNNKLLIGFMLTENQIKNLN